jgi:multidrug resistance protein
MVQLAVGLASPLVPLYATTFNVSFTLVGFAVGIFGVSRLLFEIPAGVWGDKYGRRIILILALFVFTISAIITYLASDIVTLAIARFIQGIGYSLYTGPSLALLGDIAPREKRARYIGTFYSYDWLGTAIGPVIGGYVSQYAGFRPAFLVVAMVSGAALFLTYLMIPETRIIDQYTSFKFGALLKSTRDWKLLLLCCIGMTTFFLTTGIRNTAVPLMAKSQGLSLGDIGIILTVALIINSLANMVGRNLIDRVGASRIMLISFLSVAVFLSVYPMAFGFLDLVVMTSLVTLSMSLVPLVYTELIIGMADPENRGLYFSVFRIFGDVGTLVGPVLIGFLSDLYGLSSSFYASSLICLATIIPVWGLKPLIKGRERI